MKQIFFQSQGNALHYIAALAPILWEGKATQILSERIACEPIGGVGHVCRALGTQATEHDRHFIQSELVKLLLHRDARIALGAAEGLRSMTLETSPQLINLVEQALVHWRTAQLECERCGVQIEKWSCPKCHVVPSTPHGEIVRVLAHVGATTTERLLSFCEDDCYGVKDAAIETLVEQAGEDSPLLRQLLRMFVDGSGPPKLLEELLKLSKEQLSQVSADIACLAQSRSRNVRIQFLTALPSLPFSRTDARQMATVSLHDGEASVRNVAVRSLRILTGGTSES